MLPFRYRLDDNFTSVRDVIKKKVRLCSRGLAFDKHMPCLSFSAVDGLFWGI